MGDWLSVRNLGLLIVGAGIGWCVVDYQVAHSPGPAIATVNGDAVTQRDFYAYMKASGGNEALTHLIQVTAILHAARQAHLTADESDVARAMSEIKTPPQDPHVRAMLEQEARAHILLKKLVLASVDEAEMHKFYDTFKPELTQYELVALIPKSHDDVAGVARDLKAGKPLEQVADTYPNAIGTKEHGSLGRVTARQIQATFGAVALKEVRKLKAGETSKRIDLGVGPMFVKLVAVHDSFDDLKGSIEDALFNARRNEFEDKLLRDAAISSPYINTSASPSPVGSP